MSTKPQNGIPPDKISQKIQIMHKCAHTHILVHTHTHKIVHVVRILLSYAEDLFTRKRHKLK